jgi:hypothetical protein
MKARKHPAPVLAFANRNPRPTPPVVTPEPRLWLRDKIDLLETVYPDALVEIEALVDDYLKHAGYPQSEGRR